MTIAEKLLRAKTDIDEVHEAGYYEGINSCGGLLKSFDDLVADGMLITLDNGYIMLAGTDYVADLDGHLIIPRTLESGIKVTGIANFAFYDCPSLKALTIPDSISYIGRDALSYCTNLSKIIFTGTMAQWKKIGKPYTGWTDLMATYVTCKDGTVEL